MVEQREEVLAMRATPNTSLQRTRMRAPLSSQAFGDPKELTMRDSRTGRLISGFGLSILLAVASCSTQQKQPSTLSSTKSGIPEEAIGQRYGVATLGPPADSAAFAYSEKSPVLVGGGFGEGGHNTYRFLNALRGPAGQPVHYMRIGTCCSFKTPNSPFGGEGLLEVYEISYEGGKPARLYFDWYDSGALYVPKGLTARKPE